jgi:hypothetical protein
MEISFTEEEDTELYGKYWEQPTSATRTNQSRKVSFPDILSNMNLVVENGILKHIGPKKFAETKVIENEPIIDKNSYIMNKYFNNYINPPEPSYPSHIPQTKEEYIQILIEERQKRYEQQRRIKEIKSTQMNFTTNDNPVQRKPILPSNNTLRKMVFR